MYSLKVFKFGDHDNFVNVMLNEMSQGAYSCYTWPPAPILAQYIWKNKDKIKDTNILELGAGTGLAGLVAAKLGASVTMTDYPTTQLCTENITLNHLEEKVCAQQLKWGDIGQTLSELPQFDYIIGSDCFYDTKDFEDIIVTVSYLLRRNPTAEFWTSYMERSSKRCIDYLLMQWGLTGREVPLQDFHADTPDITGSDLLHTIRLFVITNAV